MLSALDFAETRSQGDARLLSSSARPQEGGAPERGRGQRRCAGRLAAPPVSLLLWSIQTCMQALRFPPPP